MTEWILGSDVLESIKRGTQVWLFETAQAEVVGFGSIGASIWRYSRQLMSHLIAEAERVARTWSGDADTRPVWLVLMVHQDNARAIHFYEHCGFELIPGVLRHKDHRVMKLWISG